MDMKTTWMALLLAVTLLPFACSNEDQPVPDAGTDLGHDLLMGEHCVEDGQCASNLCLIYEGDDEGYCTETGCVLQDECHNHAAGETDDMCCMEMEGQFICLKVAEGYGCDDPPTPMGTPCGDNPDLCYRTTCVGEGDEAICTRLCATDADCDGSGWGPEFTCQTVEDGNRYCLIFNPVLCTASADCPVGETCSVEVNADLTDLFGECVTYGARQPGSECNDEDDPSSLSFEERCSGLYCLNGKCSEVCSEDADCPEGMICESQQFPNVDDTIMVCKGVLSCNGTADCPEGQVCWPVPVTDHFEGRCGQEDGGGDFTDAFCLADENCPEGLSCLNSDYCLAEPCGDPGNTLVLSACIEDMRCAAASECGEGEGCWPTEAYEGGLMGWCRQDEGTDPVGTACDEDNDICQVLCLEGLCTEWCTLDEDCPETMRCKQVAYCLAEPCDEDANIALGGSCVAEDYCDSPDDCDDGFSCAPVLQADSTFSGGCQEDQGADPVGTECDSQNDTCQVLCGDGRCTEWCSLDEDCGPGMLCENLYICLENPCEFPDDFSSMSVCVTDLRCSAPSDCEPGSSCRPFLDPDTTTLKGWCYPDQGTDPLGTACDLFGDGCESICIEFDSGAECTEVCTEAADCSEGHDCQPVSLCFADPCTDPANVAESKLCVPGT